MALTVKLFHLGVFSFYVYVYYFLVNAGSRNADSKDPNVKAMGKFTYRFLTNWTYCMQLIYFATCTLGHLLEIIPKTSRAREIVKSFGNSLFTTVAGPFGLLVTVSFWSLYAIDRELVYPKWIDQVIPVWVNHAIHSLNTVFPLIDIWLVNHKYPTFSFALKCTLAYLGAYGICIFGTYFETGLWIYPFMRELTWPQRGILSIVNVIVSIAFYYILLLFSRLVWGSKKEGAAKQPKSKKNAKQKSKKSA